VDLEGIQDAISDGEYRFKAADGEKPLPATAKLSSVWQRPWPSDSDDHPQLHVYITLPANMGSGECFIRLFAQLRISDDGPDLHFTPIVHLTFTSICYSSVSLSPPPLAPLALQDDETGGGLESPAKRRRLADDRNSLGGVSLVDDLTLEELRQFWKSLWEDKKDPFRMDLVRRGPNPLEGIDVPATMELMHLPITFASIGDVMVRDDYDKAMRDIENYYTRKTKSVIVVGHPGIGKTIGSVEQA
jgi:hypothetical protein